MKTIWKFDLAIEDKQTLKIPGRGQILKVGIDPRGKLCLWIIVDPEEEISSSDIRIFGTGHSIQEELEDLYYLGSVTQGDFVWHVFEHFDQ